MADTTDKVSVFDDSAPPSPDGSSGIWWKEWFTPRIDNSFVTFIVSRTGFGQLVPDAPLPPAMMVSGAEAWIGILRLDRRRNLLQFRLGGTVPFDAEETRFFTHPGPQFTDTVEAALRVAMKYGTHILTVALPVAQQDPYGITFPAGQSAALSAMLAEMDADVAAASVKFAQVALLNAATGIGIDLDISDPADPGFIVPGYEEVVRALTPTDVVLTALEISHPDIVTPVRVVNDAVTQTIGGHTYVALRFEPTLVSDEDGRPPRAELVMDNVGRDLTEWLERAGGGAGATVRVMMVLARTLEVEWELTLDVIQVSVDQRVRVRLGYHPLLDRPATPWRFDPEAAPGLF